MCYFMTANGFTMLSTEEARELYGIKDKSGRPLTKKEKKLKSMKRYFDLKDFICFLNLLEYNKETPLYTESVEDGSTDKHNFMKIKFSGNDVILYDHPSCTVGIIQDSPVAPREDYAEEVFGDLIQNGEYNMFIKV